MKQKKIIQERTEAPARAGKENGEGRIVANKGSTHTILHFVFSLLSTQHLPAPFPVGNITGKPNTFS